MRTFLLNKDQENEVICKYNLENTNFARLGKLYGVSRATIRRILKRNNIEIIPLKPNRLYTLNENYFEKIDTEKKSYILGFCYADACNYEDKNSLIIELQEEDKYILEEFKKELNSNRPLMETFRHLKKKNYKNTFVMAATSEKLSNDLNKLGCFARKSLTLKFPTPDQVPEFLISHFIRGMFDGDGSLCYSTRYDGTKNHRFDITSTEDFCLEVKKIFKEKFDIHSHLSVIQKIRITPTRKISVKGRLQILTIMDWLYKDATIFLTRKHNRYMEMKNLVFKRKLSNQT